MSNESSFSNYPNSVGPPESDEKELRQRNYVYAEIDRYRISELYRSEVDSNPPSSMEQG